MTDRARLSRRGFLALGASGALLPSRSIAAESPQIPESNGRACQTAPLRLTALKIPVGASRPFTVLHASDSHLNFMTVEDMNSSDHRDVLEFYRSRRAVIDALPSLAAVVKEARMRKLPLFHTGDLIDYESQANLSLARQAFAGIDALFVPGNHECVGYWDQKAPGWRECREARKRMSKFFPNDLTVASRVINGVNFVAFDNGGLSRDVVETEQLDRLRAEFDRGLPTVLLYHIPFYCPELRDWLVEGKGGKPVDEKHLAWGYLANAPHGGSPSERKIFEYVASRKNLKAALCGHLHAELVCSFSGSVRQYVAGATFKGQAYEITFT